MTKNKRLITIVTALVLLGLVLCGTVISYMFHISEQKDNLFTPAEVSCEVLESFDGEEKSSIAIKNTSNIAAYLRLRLVSYWVDGDGNIVAKPSKKLTFAIANGWKAGPDDTYYYISPINSANKTPNLLAEGEKIVLEQEDGYSQVVEVFAEAIQSEPTAAVESWPVTLDSNGNITAVS
ncbi:MAG: hypothetical protein IKJ50_01450 [Clostridia bacterium]|nr:hypothetical protein [Clostridia bacterium]